MIETDRADLLSGHPDRMFEGVERLGFESSSLIEKSARDRRLSRLDAPRSNQLVLAAT